VSSSLSEHYPRSRETGLSVAAAFVTVTGALSDQPYAVERHDRIGSTNERATALAREGRRDVVVVADEQTAGRGRRDRSWVGPPGGLYCSVVVEPSFPPGEYPLATLAAGVAVVRAVEPFGVDPRVKWPNDVLVDGRKLAGVLTERVDDALVVGTGVNVAVDAADLPAGAVSLADALADRGGHLDDGTAARDRIARDLLRAFAALLDSPEDVLDAWRSAADTLGRRVSIQVETPGGDVVGEAVDVVSPGALVVRTADGEVRVDAGDCEHLRSA